jgi:hypothetical protein
VANSKRRTQTSRAVSLIRRRTRLSPERAEKLGNRVYLLLAASRRYDAAEAIRQSAADRVADLAAIRLVETLERLPVSDWQVPDSMACCRKARRRFCVCFASFDCPVHGKTCIGSHD